jgi:radical SAM enzyme (TIGR01210 family)
MDKPVAIFSRADRLRDGEGIEVNIIFRSPGCAWARSESGGCTMCGYINDRAPPEITAENLWNQFTNALERQKEILENSANRIVYKMFTSGSFLDPKEIPESVQLEILTRLSQYPTIKEIVVESRPEYITEAILSKYKTLLAQKYFEVGVGVESSDDTIRRDIINKGFTWQNILIARDRLHQFGFGIKAYLIFKPPFLSEYTALFDITQSIRQCVEAGFDTISINPTNIQTHTLCEELFDENKFRSPWIYSLLWAIKHAVNQEALKHVRIISDPSAAGKERGVHNCYDKTCNYEWLEVLKKFVLTQELSVIPESFTEKCAEEWQIKLLLE